MRVALVYAHAGPPQRGQQPAVGPHQRVSRLAAELSRLGHDVRVYERLDDADAPAATEADGYQVIGVPVEPTNGSGLVGYVPAFGRWLAQQWAHDWRPDVVHGHFWVGGLAAASAAGRTTLPVVQTFHSLGLEQLRHLGPGYTGPGERIPLERALSRAVDLAVAQCSDEVDELTRMGLHRTAVVVVPAGVDTDRFRPDGERAPREPRRRRILAVGGLGPGHGHDDVIRALRLVGDAELVIVGGPPAHALDAHPEVRRLRRLAQDVGVGEQVQFIGGVPHDQMASWYRSADVVACTPRYASTGMVPLEAMACGVPVVGYARGGVADTVIDNVTGRLVPVGDIRALGVTLRRLLADEAERFAYGHAALDRVRCRYTWDRTASTLERIYERVRRNRGADPAD